MVNGTVQISQALLTAQEAAELLAVPPTWVLAEARCGRLPHVRLGRYVRFQQASLEAWLANRAYGPPLGRDVPKASMDVLRLADDERRGGG